jgi:hypothetical protein
MDGTTTALQRLASDSPDRMALWTGFINHVQARTVAEVGVYRGDFAERALGTCPSIRRYYMIDPWRHLGDWNKPANESETRFEGFFRETLEKTQPYAQKRAVLRGRTTEVVDQIPDGELDFAYIDGDHTLRGVVIDLIRLYPKVTERGWIAGDDFDRSIWEHGRGFEPTLVFPLAVHFAEAMDVAIYALPYNQFLIHAASEPGFRFIDLTGGYAATELLAQARPPLRHQAATLFDRVRRRLVRRPRRWA